MNKRSAVLVATMILLLHVCEALPARAGDASERFDHTIWNRLLMAHVDSLGRVAYRDLQEKDMAVFEKEVRSATVRAVDEAHVMKVDRKTLLRRIKEDPLLAVNLLQTMSRRIRDLNRELTAVKGESS